MSRPAKSKAEMPAERKLSGLLKDCFRIYFPTRETVASSKGGLRVSRCRGTSQIKRSTKRFLAWLELRPANRCLRELGPSASNRSGTI